MPPIFARRTLLGSLAIPAAMPLVAEASPGLRSTDRSGTAFEAALRPTIYPATGKRPAWLLSARMAHYKVPGVAVAILRDGRIVHAAGYGSSRIGTSARVGRRTMFSVGSVSKVATAALCLKLVASGVLDLDRDIDRYLTRWRVPSGPAGDRSPITLRMLMSHTAGFNVHGFDDFAPVEALPNLVQILNGQPPAKNEPLRRVDPAGLRMRYSGGGVMIEQAVIEDAIGLPLEEAAKRHLFADLGMRRTSFANPLPATWEDLAAAHDDQGRPAAEPRGWQSFPEAAASGLWTSAEDLATLVMGLIGSYRSSTGFLPRALASDMMRRVAPGNFGLGPRLSGAGSARIFHHAGSNDSYKAYIEGNLVTGDGLVVLTNGSRGDALAAEIRNAVSDTMDWPGDWSVATIEQDSSQASCAGTYDKGAGNTFDSMKALDSIFGAKSVSVSTDAEGLSILESGRTRPRRLLPVALDRYVMAEAYVPAGTLQFEFQRGADRAVRGLIVDIGDGVTHYSRRG